MLWEALMGFGLWAHAPAGHPAAAAAPKSPAVLMKSRRDQGAGLDVGDIEYPSVGGSGASAGERAKMYTRRRQVSIGHWPKHVDSKGFLGYCPWVESVLPSPSARSQRLP